MKSIQQLYDEVAASEELQKEFVTLTDIDQVIAFAKKNGCEAAEDEVKAFFEKNAGRDNELSDAELDAVAGGKDNGQVPYSANPRGTQCFVISVTVTAQNPICKDTFKEWLFD